MAEPENTVKAREDSISLQLAGSSAAVTAEEAAAGVEEARRDFAGRGGGYGVGFGYVKNLGSPRGLDGIRLEYAITDGGRVANVHAIISGTRLSILASERHAEAEPDARLRAWVLGELHEAAGSIARSDDRYRTPA